MPQITYLFDPLCGWCYGAAPALHALHGTAGLTVDLAPTGLFSDAGARPMDAGFAAYAWSNDQRIERLTGQRFTEAYRNQVLADHGTAFDSGPATLALTAVALSAPEREAAALQAIQEARYVEGRDITALPVLAEILAGLGLDAASARIATPDPELRAANLARTGRAQSAMRQFGAQGVPSLIVTQGTASRLLPSSLLFGDPAELLTQLNAG